MSKRLLGLASVLAGLAAGLAGAGAAELQRTSFQPLVLKGTTRTPIGAREFCLAHPAECAPVDVPAEPVALTGERFAELDAVNARFNEDIVAVTDIDHYGVREFWTYPDGYGDCEDFALAKRRALIERGWPASALLMTLVHQRNGDAHAVLVVRTDRGDFVLDNLIADVRDWDTVPYTFIKMQTPETLDRWIDLTDERVIWVASN